MRTHVRKHVAMMLSVCLLLGTLVPIPVSGAGESVSVVLSKDYLVKSAQAQTVEMYVRVTPAVEAETFVYRITADESISVSSVSANQDRFDPMNIDGDSSHMEEIDGGTQLGRVTFTIPANTEGVFELGISGCALYNGTTYLFSDVEASTVLTVVSDAGKLPAQDRTATLNGPATALTGDGSTVAYTIDITGDAYQSAELKLAYDSTRLEFDTTANPETMTAKNGVVTIVQYGENQTPSYTVKFKAINTGTAAVTLTSAAFGTSDTAVSGDLTPAIINKGTVNTVINKAFLTVALPEGVVGATSVNYGESYTFMPTFAEPTKYDYTVTANMGGQPVEVIKNDNGTYTIAKVTGDLEIIVTPTAKKYTISFATGTVKAALPAGGEVTYGVPYTFSLPTEDGCTLAVTSATVGGQNYSCPDPVDNKVTIPGDAIVGDIVINIERVSATVTIGGTGKADAEGQQTVKIGEDYTLIVNKDASCNYTVTATMDGTAVTSVEGTNTYTIQNVTGPIVFQIHKTINSDIVKVSQYITLDGSAVWLVRSAVDKLSDGVYTYNGIKMIWSEAYNAYCCLVISATEPTVSADTLKLVSGTADELAFSLNVNQSKNVDANDAQLIHDLYNGKYTNFSVVTMEKFLLADTNKNGVVETNDAIVVVDYITGQ